MARIVVVEQDQLIRALLVKWLGSAGHSVVAYSRVEAMTSDEADTLIVDVAMPRLDRHSGALMLRELVGLRCVAVVSANRQRYAFVMDRKSQ